MSTNVVPLSERRPGHAGERVETQRPVPPGPARSAESPSTLTSLTLAEVAEYLSVSKSCARGWARSGQLPALKDGSGRWVIPRHRLNEFLEACRVEADEEVRRVQAMSEAEREAWVLASVRATGGEPE